MRDTQELSLATVWWSVFFRGYDCKPIRSSLAIGLPLVGLGIILGAGLIMTAGVILGGLSYYWVLLMEQDAHATASAVVWRDGMLGLSRRSIPITAVDDVIVEPVKGYLTRTESSHIADLTIRYGLQHVTFEAVPHAEVQRQRLYELRDAARLRSQEGKHGVA